MLSKRESGHRLPGSRASASKAAAIAHAPEMTAGAMFEVIALTCLEQFRVNRALILERRDAAALHRARVALRRLRSAQSIHKEMLAERPYDAFGRELRWLATELGRARDLDVLLDRADQGPLRARLVEARDRAYASAESTLRSARARRLMRGLAEWIAAGAWRSGAEAIELRDRPVGAFAARALARLRKKVAKGGRELAGLDDEARHELRKSAKKLRYGAEFFGGLYPGKRERRRRKRFVAALETLQDELGMLNDLRIAGELMAGLGLAGDRDAQRLLRSGGKSELLAAAAKQHARLVEIPPFWR